MFFFGILPASACRLIYSYLTGFMGVCINNINNLMAERVGFEPTVHLLGVQPISSRPRYSLFGTSPHKEGMEVWRLKGTAVSEKFLHQGPAFLFQYPRYHLEAVIQAPIP
jgi:hypothetical protein